MSSTRNYILDQTAANKKMKRMALEIIEKNEGEDELILAGIKENGSVVASCMKKMLEEISSIRIELISIELDKRNPGKISLSEEMDFNNKVIIVVDDVANSGKTLLYALQPFLQYHPKKIQALALVERSHSSFPVQPDYVGLPLSTTLQEHIFVEVNGDQVLGAYLQ